MTSLSSIYSDQKTSWETQNKCGWKARHFFVQYPNEKLPDENKRLFAKAGGLRD